jgi:hypothetical protein
MGADVFQEIRAYTESAAGRARGSQACEFLVVDGRNRWCRATARPVRPGRPHADHGRFSPHTGLSRSHNDCVLPIYRRRHARPRCVRCSSIRGAVAVTREAGVCGIAQIARDKEVLVARSRRTVGLREGNRNWRDRRDEERGRRCRSVGDAGNICDLDNVRGSSKNSRGNRMNCMGGGAVISALGESLLCSLVPLLLILPRLLFQRLPPCPDKMFPD